jgi:hypothetical protein
VPDPFGAEQTYLTEKDIKEAQKERKGSYDEMDHETMPERSEIVDS